MRYNRCIAASAQSADRAKDRQKDSMTTTQIAADLNARILELRESQNAYIDADPHMTHEATRVAHDLINDQVLALRATVRALNAVSN